MIFSPDAVGKHIAREDISIEFPVPLLSEQGDKIQAYADANQLRGLVEAGAIIGIGKKNKIKTFRLLRPIEALIRLRFKLRVRPSAADNKTTFVESFDSGGKAHAHHWGRSEAYSPEVREVFR